ncbi:MAG: acyl-CoA reductase [Ignavibacteria bacterium]|nr:acyl-CoA reductase [Ignavibacteria bacterium]
MSIKVFLPNLQEAQTINEIITPEFINLNPMVPFSRLSIDFLNSISRNILAYRNINDFPELVALAYWLRRANITQMVSSFTSTVSAGEFLLPCGIAFHIAPSNVDSIFLYSWALSLIAGNKNIVRVTQYLSEQISLLLEIIRTTVSDNEFADIASRNIIITYPREDEINRQISGNADLRLIWGGDETIRSIRRIDAKPACRDIAFADKFSYSVINARTYNNSDEQTLKQLAENFYNDSYWFDQKACSSPIILYFSGTPEQCRKASQTFWNNLTDILYTKKRADSAGLAMDKLVFSFENMLESEKIELLSNQNFKKPSVMRITKSEIPAKRNTCGGGFFYECFIESLSELEQFIADNDQTLTYSGFSQDELENFIHRACAKGIVRIVPIGQALLFNPVWDGFVLLSELTKRLTLK